MYKNENKFIIKKYKETQETIISLCIQHDLHFTEKQLAEIIYFINEFPFIISENSLYISLYNNDYNIFQDFFNILILPNYHKNNLNTKNKENYIIKIIHMFNTLPRMYMSLEEYKNFLFTFYFVDNVNIFHTISVLFGDKIHNSEWTDNWEEESSFNRP